MYGYLGLRGQCSAISWPPHEGPEIWVRCPIPPPSSFLGSSFAQSGGNGWGSLLPLRGLSRTRMGEITFLFPFHFTFGLLSPAGLSPSSSTPSPFRNNLYVQVSPPTSEATCRAPLFLPWERILLDSKNMPQNFLCELCSCSVPGRPVGAAA